MKEFCIEITPEQPLDKVEAKLKEMGYRFGWRNKKAKHQPMYIGVYENSRYDVYSHPFDGLSPLKTLEEL